MTRVFTSFVVLVAVVSGCAVSSTPFVTSDAGPTPDGAPSDAKSDAPTDAAPPKDGASDAAPPSQTKITCGSIFCRADQQCQNSTCITPCTGSSVPGDYASIQAAITALATAQMDATICLGSQTYAENVTATASPNKQLTIIGPSGAKLTALSVTGSYSKVTLKGLAVTTLTVNSASPIELTGMHADTFQASTGQSGAITIDGCDLGAAAQTYALYVARTTSSQPLTVTVQNSWLHGASYGAYVSGSSTTNLAVSLVNDTFSAGSRGLYATTTGNVTLTYVNSIFTGLTVAGITLTGTYTLTHGNNLLFGNGANYAGTAVDGAGYVKADPMLDTATPPEPKQGSPARGAADKAKAPPKDYWAATRGTPTDIGAVQGN
jgi:hypothetical protein